MTRTSFVTSLVALAAVIAATQAADANSLQRANGAVAIVHGVPPGPPAGPVAKVCSGPSVTVWVRNPATGRREKECKCAPGAVGRLIENGETGAKELRCIGVAGPRP